MSNIIKDEEIQEQLVKAAKQLFELHGFRRVTIDDIAKAIGKARSSLYYYYKTKEEILDAVIAAEIRELVKLIATAISEVKTSEEKIKAFFLTDLRAILEKRGFFNALDEGMNAGELSGFQKTRFAVYQQVRLQESTLLRQIITEGIGRGELMELGQKEKEDFIFVILSSLHGMKREMVIKNEFGNMESSVNFLVHSLIHGLKK
ncbi:TetR family transcriptional regulator [Mucilaginibacter gracilis]|uniref:TetR family transcriptional regulator n=1 Tax=Mucilaginibacter gracilis TaxID=423350 RepID=A0A495IZ85_9SPHI|nr:TetR/AcrR family transcriptional regulator [Mucilaginibacter gracilis]RKR82025.1 TetR family transcriptional regulator [Mucilaginibacter gracilis]